MPASTSSIPSPPRQPITLNLISATNPSRHNLSSATLTISLVSAPFKMLFAQLPVLLLTAMMLPSFAEAGIFYKNSPVKMLDAKSFKKVMRENVRWAFVGNALS